MADRNPKRIKLDPEPEVPQPAATAVTAKPSIHKMLRIDLIQEVKEVRQKYTVIAISKNQLKADYERNLDAVSKQNQELTTERDSLLHQLQHEISKSEALRQQLLEHQSIVDSAMHESTIRMQEMSEKIKLLTLESQFFRCVIPDLTEQLDKIKEENTCAICLSPWEGQGDHRIVSLPCGHLFGKHCIRDHLGVNPKCPYCKQDVPPGATRYIYGCRVLPLPEVEEAQFPS